MTKRELWAALVGLVVGCIIVSVSIDQRAGRNQTEAVAHTAEAKALVIRVDTVRLQAGATAAAARIIFRDRADTVLNHLTDTVRVKEFVTLAGETITKHEIALVADSAAIAARDTVIVRVERERDLALARPAPRFAASVAGLWDPISQTPAASLEASYLVRRNVGVIVRGDLRFGSGAHASLGITVRL